MNTDTTFAPTTKLITDDTPGTCLYAGVLRTVTVPAIEELITETARKLARRIPGVTFHLSKSDHLRTDGTDPMWCSEHRQVDCDRRTDPDASPCTERPTKATWVVLYAQGLPVFDGLWRVAGVLSIDSEGAVTGSSILDDDGFARAHRDMAGRCAHCNKIRRRSTTVLLHNTETGEVRPVGKTCLAEYTGGMIRAEMLAGLIGLGERFATAVANTVDHEPETAPTVEVVALAREIVETHGFIRSGYGYAGEPDTRSRLYDAVCPPEGLVPEFSAARLTDADLDAARADIAAVLAAPTDGDYLANLQEVVGTDWVQVTGKRSRLGLLASLPAAADRARRNAEPQPVEQELPSEWIGQEGERMEVTGRVALVRWVDNGWGGTNLIKVETDRGTVKMFTMNRALSILEEGAEVTVKGTVKEHDVYNDCRETLISRPTLVTPKS